MNFDLGRLGLGRLSLICGDIAAEAADVLVNEANDHLQMTGGVAGALRKRGGVAIHQEAIALGPLPLGRVVRTSGKVVTTVVQECLAMAAVDEAESICFPLFGAGGGSQRFGMEMPLTAFEELNAGAARRDEESKPAEDYPAQLVADLGDLDLG